MQKKEAIATDDYIPDESKQGEVLTAETQIPADAKQFYVESYGCAMNFSDTEVVASILREENYFPTKEMASADLILINTCSIREKAEQNVRQRLTVFNQVKKNKPATLVGVLGCMAERLKSKFLDEEKLVDIVVGPDAYRDLPKLIDTAKGGERTINVLLSREETYADISPVRLDSNGVTSFISIMRGCDNMCSFCVVPFTRGRERSRDVFSILAEAEDLFKRGYKEVTLLGQNVDSYKWENPETKEVVNFAQLLVLVSKIHPDLRIRFSTSHPKDITDEVMYAIRDHENICNYIHLPVQSGSSRILKLMNRTYDRPWYKQKIDRIREIIPDCSISSDVIAGFCTETEEDHQETLSMMEYANYCLSYMFYYSERPGTLAERKYEDDVPLEVKKRRLKEIVQKQKEISHANNLSTIGKTYRVLIEGDSKKSDKDFKGRNSGFLLIVFPKKGDYKVGDYVNVEITSATSNTMLGKIV